MLSLPRLFLWGAGANAAAPVTMAYKPDLCIDVDNAAQDDGTRVQIWRCDGYENQMFEFVNNAIRYTPNGEDINKCIDAVSGVEGDSLVLWECNGYAQQHWDFNSDTDQFILESGLCMAIDGGTTDGKPVKIASCQANWKQMWGLGSDVPSPPPPPPAPSPDAGSPITFSANSGLCLDVAGGFAEDGTPVQIWDCLGTAQQNWLFNEGMLVSGLDQSKCLDAGPTMDRGFNVMLWSCNGYPQQMWAYDDQYMKTIYLNNGADASYCLDAPGGYLQNGNQMWIWDCYGNDAQSFAFTPNR